MILPTSATGPENGVRTLARVDTKGVGKSGGKPKVASLGVRRTLQSQRNWFDSSAESIHSAEWILFHRMTDYGHRYTKIRIWHGLAMANTNALIVGGVLLIGGILTIPLIIGIFCAPAGCFVMLIGLLASNPVPQQQVMYMPQQGR